MPQKLIIYEKKRCATHQLSCIRSLIIFTFFGLIISANGFAQLAPVNPPSGGFRIEGDLTAGTPTAGEGDWIQGTSGGYVLLNNGNVIDTNKTKHAIDYYNSTTDDVFSGSAFSDNPNNWKWSSASAANKTDINNGMYNISSGLNQKWIMMAGDRLVNTGTSYIDFEFYQGKLYKNANGTFTSLAADSSSLSAYNGRTPGDFVLSMEYTNGGSTAKVHFYRWELSGTVYHYIEHAIPSGSSGALAFGATNSTPVAVPFGAFGANIYPPFLFVEAAVNIDALLGAIDPCAKISIKTVFIKTKASDSYNAALKDFISPIDVNFVFGQETATYPSGPFYNCGTITPTVTGSGTFSATPAGLSINATTGIINLSESLPGTYTVTYTYQAGGGCNMPTQATIVVNALPAANSVPNQTLCSGSNTTAVNFSSSLNPVSFAWTNSNTSIGLAASGTGNIGSFVAANSGSIAISGTISYTPSYTTNGATCNGPSGSFIINVNPLPAKPTVSITEPSLCGASTGTVSVTAPTGTSYMYKNNDGAWQSGIDFSGIAAGAGYNIWVKDVNGCVSAAAAGCEAMMQQRKRETNVKPTTPTAEKQNIVSDISTTLTSDHSVEVKTYPNPFTREVNLFVSLQKAGNGFLEIYNLQGAKIKTVYQGYFSEGTHRYRIQLPEGNGQFVYILNISGEKLSGQLMQLSE